MYAPPGVTFDFGFTPSADEMFTFLTADAGELSGMFSSDTFDGFACPHCTLVYNDASGTVTLDVGSTATPEPTGFLLMGTGLLGLAALEKMRQRRPGPGSSSLTLPNGFPDRRD